MIETEYSVYDKKAKLYNPPFVASNDDVAMRLAGQIFQSSKMFSEHPHDFVVYKICTFDNATGEVKDLAPEVLCEFADFINPEE